ncbi:hypothetical protein ACIOJD_34140 [Streptomyces sp. NPDC088116]|uniref:hypothetical protein n=1 Tax=Streptomyces sp. NPDC088116 TaxID=3365825 RepID=UPI0037F15C88
MRHGHLALRRRRPTTRSGTGGSPVNSSLPVAEVPLCDYCGHARDALIVVGVVHSASGPGRAMRACPSCRTARRLLPLADHPDGSLGLVLSARPRA